MTSSDSNGNGEHESQGRKLRRWWLVALLACIVLVLSAVLLREPPLPAQAAKFLGTWTYLPVDGTKHRFFHFRDDKSAIWWKEGETKLRDGRYFEWELRDDSLELRLYMSKGDAFTAKLLVAVHGPAVGDEYDIDWVSEDEFTMHRDYRDRTTGEMVSETISYRRTEVDEIPEFGN